MIMAIIVLIIVILDIIFLLGICMNDFSLSAYIFLIIFGIFGFLYITTSEDKVKQETLTKLEQTLTIDEMKLVYKIINQKEKQSCHSNKQSQKLP